MIFGHEDFNRERARFTIQQWIDHSHVTMGEMGVVATQKKDFAENERNLFGTVTYKESKDDGKDEEKEKQAAAAMADLGGFDVDFSKFVSKKKEEEVVEKVAPKKPAQKQSTFAED